MAPQRRIGALYARQIHPPPNRSARPPKRQPAGRGSAPRHPPRALFPPHAGTRNASRARGGPWDGAAPAEQRALSQPDTSSLKSKREIAKAPARHARGVPIIRRRTFGATERAVARPAPAALLGRGALGALSFHGRSSVG